MTERKKHLGFGIFIIAYTVGLPLVFIFIDNVWIGIVLLILYEITAWLGFIYFIRLSEYNAQEVREQGESMDDILKLAYDKCMEARTATKSKSSFLAQMSHEIRTPINAVLGMNEMILREAKDPAILDYASNAYNAGAGLLAIINDILDISKIEAGKLELVEAEYDLYSLVSDCYHMTAERAAKKDLAFLFSVEETLPAKLYGDMFHLRQIVVNFLTNAIKYTDEGSVELIFAGLRKGDKFSLRIQVKDTGIGLTEESVEHLFTSFQRFDLKRNQSVEGTGLGLSICKQLTELMGGTVEVESVYGKGSTFSCTIPQRIVDELPIGKVVLDHAADRNIIKNEKKFTAPTARILVVDDVQMNLLVFSSLLKEHKFIIDEATSGKQCLELVQKQNYDVIFMDHMMPEMDGVETYAHMKEMEHENKNTPVVMLTANAISGEKEKYLAEGFASYLTKPIQSDKLEEALLSYIPQDKIVWEDVQEKSENQAESGVESAEEMGTSADKEFFDPELGVFYAGGNQEIYRTILGSYLDGSQDRLTKIRNLYGSEAWKDYVTEVHALKSTSLTIGAKELSEAAKELELAGKAGEYDTIRQKNEGLLAMYGRVLEVAGEWLGREVIPVEAETEVVGNMEPIDEDKLNEGLARIIAAADGFDGDEIIAVCEELSAYSYGGVPLRDRIKEIQSAAADFEYEQARELAEKIGRGDD